MLNFRIFNTFQIYFRCILSRIFHLLLYSGLNEPETCPSSLLNVKKQFVKLLVLIIKIQLSMSLFNQYLWSLIVILTKIKIFQLEHNKLQSKYLEIFRVFWKFISGGSTFSGNFLRSNIIIRDKTCYRTKQAKSDWKK